MRKSVLFGVITALGVWCSSPAMAQRELGVFNTLAVGVSAGSVGIGVDVATPVTPYFAIRGGVSIMPGFHPTTDVDANLKYQGTEITTTVNLKGDTKRTSGELLVNFYPFPSGVPFFVTAGASFGGSKLLKIDGHSDELAEYMKAASDAGIVISDAGIVIGDQKIPVDKNGNVSGGFEVSKVRPYVGLGFGRVVPKKRIGVQFELGVQFHGRPDLYTSTGRLSKAAYDEDDDFTKIMDKLTVYPVMKLRFCGRLF